MRARGRGEGGRVELVPFEMAHLEGFVPGVRERAILADLARPDPQAWVGRAVSLRAGGRTLGIAGLFPAGGRTHVSLLLSDELRRRPVALHRLACEHARAAAAGGPPGPLEAWAAARDRTAQCWLRRLGFAPAGTARAGAMEPMRRFVLDPGGGH